MKLSNLVAGVLSVGLLAGAAYALDKSGEKGIVGAREAICANAALSVDQQTDCKAQMKAATSETEKQQISTRFHSKAEMREFRESIGVTNSGGVSGAATTPSLSGTDKAATGSMNKPNATTQPAAPSAPAVKK